MASPMRCQYRILPNIANGRRRRCAIECLWEGGNLLEHPDEIRSRIYSFYMVWFLASPHSGVLLAEDFCIPVDRVSDDENTKLTLPFLEGEVGRAITSMKAGSTSEPDGLLVAFFYKFWNIIKSDDDVDVP